MPKPSEKNKQKRENRLYRRRRKPARSRTDWARLDALTEEEIDYNASRDTDALPLLEADWLQGARVVIPQPKAPVSIRLDKDVLEFFRRTGPRYQTRINAVLRTYVEAQTRKRRKR